MPIGSVFENLQCHQRTTLFQRFSGSTVEEKSTVRNESDDARDSLLLGYIDQTDFVDAKDLITRLKATVVLGGTARNNRFDIDSLKLL